MEEALKDQTNLADESYQRTGEPLSRAISAEVADTFIAGVAQFIRHYPLAAMTAAFSGGALVGWLVAHDLKRRLSAASEQRQQKARDEEAKKRAIARWEGEGGALLSKKKGDKN